MRTTKVKASSYTTVNTESIIRYIEDYNKEIAYLVADKRAMFNTDRTTLKSVAAQLETVAKQLKRTR